MKLFVRYITSIIIEFIKRLWYNIKIKKLKAEIEKQRKELKREREKSDNIVDDFESEYELYKRNREKPTKH